MVESHSHSISVCTPIGHRHDTNTIRGGGQKNIGNKYARSIEGMKNRKNIQSETKLNTFTVSLG